MKTKLISGVLAMLILLSLSLVGCSNNGDEQSTPAKSSSNPTGTGNENSETESPQSSGYTKEDLLAMPEANADDFSVKDVDGGVSITGVYSKNDVLIIPAQINGKDVVAIGFQAFFGDKFKAVLLPDSIVAIGEKAFLGCENLEVVYVKGNSLKKLDTSVFSMCGKLKYIELPASVDEINPLGLASVTIITPAGSYAETYANQNEFEVKNSD